MNETVRKDTREQVISSLSPFCHMRIQLKDVCLCVCVYVCVSTHMHSVVSSSLQPHGLQPARLLSLRDFPGKNTGVGCHFLLQGICPIQD